MPEGFEIFDSVVQEMKRTQKNIARWENQKWRHYGKNEMITYLKDK